MPVRSLKHSKPFPFLIPDVPVGDGTVTLSEWVLLNGEFTRSGNDLIILDPTGGKTLVPGYFSGAATVLKTAAGAVLLPETVEALLLSEGGASLVAGPALVKGAKSGKAATKAAGKSIGTASQLVGKVTAKGSDGTVRTLEEGDPIFKGDVIKTGKDGLIKVVFIDDTEFQLGSDARGVINNYVYNAAQSTGRFDATVVKGVFRYSSGKLALKTPGRHSSIKTPTAVIGIRGSELQGQVESDGSTTVVHSFGVLDISDAFGNATVTLLEPGTATAVRFGAGAPEPVFKAPPGFMARLNAQINISRVKKAIEKQREEGDDGKKDEKSQEESKQGKAKKEEEKKAKSDKETEEKDEKKDEEEEEKEEEQEEEEKEEEEEEKDEEKEEEKEKEKEEGKEDEKVEEKAEEKAKEESPAKSRPFGGVRPCQNVGFVI